MSEKMLFPWISLGITILAVTTIWTWRQSSAEKARRGATIGLLATFLTMLATGLEAFRGHGNPLAEPLPVGEGVFSADPLNGLLLPLYSGLTLGMIVLAPRRKVTPRWLSGLLILAVMTLTAYAANNLAVFALAWTATLIPFLKRHFFSQTEEHALPPASRIILTVSAILLVCGTILLIMLSAGPTLLERLSLSQPRIVQPGENLLAYAAFTSLLLAIILRKGLFPAHSWVAPSFENGPLIPLTLLFNGHLGAFALARLVLPLLPGISNTALPLVGDLGLLTAGLAAVLAISERSPRRLLALLSISQSSFIVTGLESSNQDAVAGALVHWQVVVVATSVLTAVYAGIEARLGTPLEGRSLLGLARSAPRLAVFFAIAGLALVGLPLTLGFVAEDLLLHGTLETHPQLGFILPVVTALNAFHIIRLFATIFLGRPSNSAPTIPDALPRERWVLTAAIVLLILGGLFPALLVRLPVDAAEHILKTVLSSATLSH